MLERVNCFLSDDKRVNTLGVGRRSIWLRYGLNLDIKLCFKINKLGNKFLNVFLPNLDWLNQLLQSLIVHDRIVLHFNNEFVRGSEYCFEQKNLVPKMHMIKSTSD